MASAVATAPSVLEIDLGRLVSNYRLLCARLGGVPCAGVVKADGYGLGAVPVAEALAGAGCTTFFVAHASEAISLRAALPAPEIYILNGILPGEEDTLVAGGVAPVLSTLEQIETWARAARRLGSPLPAAIHFDTGMSRLGLTPGESARLIAERHRLDGIRLRYVLSHLACADEPEHPLNAQQLARFRAIRAQFPEARASFANSSGIFLGPDYHFDLGRPGAALHGINPLPGHPNPLAQVVHLQARILQTREIDSAQTVGYGASYRAPGPRRIATVALGYADGYPRALSSKGSAYCGDRVVPIVGRVSMDLITLDVSAVPNAHVGQMVEFLGDHRPLDVVAEEADTIGYELLTQLGKRFHRIYRGAAG